MIDPASRTDTARNIAVSSGRITAIDSDISVANCDIVIDASAAYVLPGLIDFHTHAYWSVYEYGVEPDITYLPRSMTTVLDVGSAGALGLC